VLRGSDAPLEPRQADRSYTGVKLAEAPFAAAGGLDEPPRSEEDPYRSLDDLMAAIEVLCPAWPPRHTFPPDMDMRL
jgi:hypothetical protein